MILVPWSYDRPFMNAVWQSRCGATDSLEAPAASA